MTEKIIIAHLTSVHPPNDVRIFLKECCSLAKEGFEVYLIVPGVDSKNKGGVTIVPVTPPENRKQRIFRTTWEIYKKAIAINADIYHFHDPELMPVGVLLALRGKSVVYDVHEELANDILDKEWIKPALRPMIAYSLNLFEQFSSMFFAGIVITRPSLYKKFNKKKTVLVHNYPMKSELSQIHGEEYCLRPQAAAYVGGASPERGIRELVESLALLPNDYEFELSLAGIISPPEFLSELKTLSGWKRVKYLGWQTRPQVAELLSRVSRFGVVTFLPIANHLESEPTKLFEYMSAGLPVIASNMPHWESLVRQNGFGILADPCDPKAIAEAIKYLIANTQEAEQMGIKGQRAVMECFNWEQEVIKLVTLYKGLI